MVAGSKFDRLFDSDFIEWGCGLPRLLNISKLLREIEAATWTSKDDQPGFLLESPFSSTTSSVSTNDEFEVERSKGGVTSLGGRVTAADTARRPVIYKVGAAWSNGRNSSASSLAGSLGQGPSSGRPALHGAPLDEGQHNLGHRPAWTLGFPTAMNVIIPATKTAIAAATACNVSPDLHAVLARRAQIVTHAAAAQPPSFTDSRHSTPAYTQHITLPTRSTSAHPLQGTASNPTLTDMSRPHKRRPREPLTVSRLGIDRGDTIRLSPKDSFVLPGGTQNEALPTHVT